MPKDIVVLGPPGTGKTTSGVLTAKGWFNGNIATSEVAYLAFTKAAAREAASRILDDDFKKDFGDVLPYFRTLHSLAYMGLRKAKPDVRLITTADMKGFAKWSSLEGAYAVNEWEDISEVYRKLQERGGGEKTQWDECFDCYTFSRISSRNLDDLERAKVMPSRAAEAAMGRIEQPVYEMFVKKYETYKAVNNLVDFTDMLTYALTEMAPIDDVKRVIIDEAQDISPLLFSIADRLFQNAEEIWWLGDDDQCIFNFSGADASLFINRARRATRLFLRQTHRFGDDVVRLSRRIIGQVSDRVNKEVLGAHGRNHTIRMTGDFQPRAQGDTLLLHRHVAGCKQLAASYMGAGVPFRNERGHDPLGPRAYSRIQAYKALRDLACGKNVTMGDATRLIDDLMPAMVDTAAYSLRALRREGALSDKTRLVIHGGKKKMQNSSISAEVGLMDLMRNGILTLEGADAIRQKHFQIFKNAEDLEYYDNVVENGYDLEGDCPVITTIHGSKGRQAGKVVVFTEMSQRCWQDEDTEHRLAYVAATRTQGELEVCRESRLPWSRVSHYNYPLRSDDAAANVTPFVADGK